MLHISERQISVTGLCTVMSAVLLVVSTVAASSALTDDLPAICNAPIGLRIEVIDPGFGVSQADVKSAIEQAASLWGAAAHHPLFVYDPKGEIAIDRKSVV